MTLTHAYDKACHVGPKQAFSHKGINVYAGSHKELQGDLDWALRIRISDGWSSVFDTQVKLSGGADELFSDKLTMRKVPPTIDIEWPDFEAPDMDNTWWEEVAAGILKLPAGSNIVVYCLGGHGRTGTALSILAILMEAVPPKEDAVLWLRDKYCQKIVESSAQLTYIEDMTGTKVKAKSSFVWSSYGVTDYETKGTINGSTSMFAGQDNHKLVVPDHLDDGIEELWTDPKTGTRWLVAYNKAGDVTTMRLDHDPVNDKSQALLPLVKSAAIAKLPESKTALGTVTK